AFADQDCLIGLILQSRRHGDFAVMERIYAGIRSRNPLYARWDAWFQESHAAEAVRNRKTFLVGFLADAWPALPAGSRIAVLESGGQLLIGNFSRRNCMRGAMSCAGWNLFERNEAELLTVARAAGYPAHRVWVGSEPEQVNLFLTIRAG